VLSFHPGQRWISNTESELGLGIVLEVANRRVKLSFPAAGEQRTYATDIAPLCRVRYEVGQQVRNIEGQAMLISSVEEHDGCLVYTGLDENEQHMQLSELDLDSFVQFSKPQERLFAGQIDKNKAFELRVETLRHYRRLQQSKVTGLLGARIQLLPHQLYIASETATRYAPRVLLADEVGLGKTIEAGLIIHQQLITGRSGQVMIALPDSLIHQWLVEMLRRFNLHFTILDEQRCLALDESEPGNPFESAQLVLCGLDFLVNQPDRMKQAAEVDWDLLVVDEAHHLQWSDHQASPAYQCIETLSKKAKGLLLLTATPEQLGIEGHFARLRLLDPARYYDLDSFIQEEARYAPVNTLVQQLLAHDGAEKISTDGVQQALEKFLGATALKKLNDELNSGASSPADMLNRLVGELLDRHGTGRVLFRNTRNSVKGFPQRKLMQHLLDAADAYTADGASAFALENGLETLLRPEQFIGEDWLKLDPRVAWLVDFLQQRRNQKILVICARAETALELEAFLRLKHGVHSAVFHQGLSLVARDRAAAYFADEEQGAQVLVCSEIGSEGRNFQFSHQLVLFDLPLNPDLLEQRIGRLDRIGQRHEIELHVPVITGSAQQVLLRWYHEGVDAFEHTCAIGQSLYQQFEQELRDCLLKPADETALDHLLQHTRAGSIALSDKLRNGRDRLLELNSFDVGRAGLIVAAIEEQERTLDLANYMENVFDQFGIDQEYHTAASIVLRPGEHMLGHSFPALPEEGLTATYQRDMALLREDIHYLTWEHPMVSGAMDLVMSGDFGNSALCTIKMPHLKAGMILLEAVFTISCTAPPALQLYRYLPLTIIRKVVDGRKNDLSEIFSERVFNKLAQKVRRHRAQDFVRHARQRIVTMIECAELLASVEEQSVIDTAVTQMHAVQQAEQQRLQALARVNPNIRQDEIDYLLNETSELQHYLNTAKIKLEAIRIAVVTE